MPKKSFSVPKLSKDFLHDIRLLEKIKRTNDTLQKLDWSHYGPDVRATLIEFHSDYVSWMLRRLWQALEKGE